MIAEILSIGTELLLGQIIDTNAAYLARVLGALGIDVYRKDLEPCRSRIDYALFIAFFPHLVAGPIQRPIVLLPQVIKARTIRWDQVNAGLFLVAWELMSLFAYFLVIHDRKSAEARRAGNRHAAIATTVNAPATAAKVDITIESSETD